MAFYNQEINDIFKSLKTSKNGINANSIEERVKLYGSNELDKQKNIGFIKRVFMQFKNVMIIILLLSAIVSATTAVIQHDYEELFEGILIFVIVLVNAIVGVIQEQKAENALSALASSTEPYAKVIRDGNQQKIKVHEVVVGDIVMLKSGDCVPADIRIIECSNFKCNESSMTGESTASLKSSQTLSKKNLSLSEQSNLCFSGTSVTSGTALGVVVNVGKNTEFGKIAGSLSSSIKEKTPLEKNIDKIGKVITFAVLAIVLVVFLVQLFFSKNADFVGSLLTAVTLAVAAIPESLPAVITIIMALGVQKLARKNAIIKRLSAVETLGCCNVICSDKTGTLTKNKMTAKHIYSSLQIHSADDFSISESPVLEQTLCLCNNITVLKDGTLSGDATETAIINFLKSQNIDYASVKSKYKKISENEFNSKRKLMSVIFEKDNKKIMHTKGALDYLLPKCTKILINEAEKELTPKLKQKIIAANEKVCLEGERVIAFAMKNISESSEESELTFLGFMGIIDPPREEVLASIAECKTAGLKTIMITGDHPATAFAIAKKLKIAKHQKEVLTGTEISKLSQQQLGSVIENYSVFARVTPEHKLMIVKALKEHGHIVSMTGDGVNDAPSVKTANIGVCMGITGTDVTKEVADVIISDDNFSTIVLAIKEGRTIYQNITKTIIFLLSTNIVEVLGIFVTSLVMPNAIFLLPTQILFINLVTDSLPAFALGIEPSEKNIMSSPPRSAKDSILSGATGWTILYQGFIQTLIVLVMFVFSNRFFGNEIASTMSFLTICLMQIIHAINCKTERTIFKTNIFKNHFFNFSFIFLLGLILAVYFIPVLANLFSLTAISTMQWLIVIATSLAIIPVVEIGKIVINKKR